MLIVDEDTAVVESLEAGIGDGVHPVQCSKALFQAAAFCTGQYGEGEGIGGLFAVGVEEPVAEFVGEVETLGKLISSREGEAVDEKCRMSVAIDPDGGGAETHEVGTYALYEWPLLHG